MTASPASVKTSRWAKFLLFGSTMLFAYSLLVLLAAHAHHYHHHEHGEHHHHHHRDHHHHSRSLPMGADDGGRGAHHPEHPRPPHHECPVHHVAGLAMITALTGIAASFTQRRGLATLFIVVLLVTELAALGTVSHGAKKAVEMCHLKNQQIRVEQTLVIARGPNAIAVGTLDRYSVTQDKAGEEDCIKRVHHHIGLGSLMIGVICTALACCGSRMGRAIVEEEVESAKMREAYAASHQQRNIIQVAVVVPASAEEDSSALNNDEEDPYNGHEDSEKTVLITRA